MITKTSANQRKLQSGREVITVNGNLPNKRFQVFISNLTLEDLYNNDYHIYGAKNVTPEILETNTTAGRQLLQSIGREFPSIHSSLEIENTMSISVLQILIEIFQQVDITQLKLDMQFKMHSILDITDKKCIQDSTLLPVKKKFMFYYWFAYDSNINYVQLWTKNFRPFMNQEHSAELKAWETEVNQATETEKYDEDREKAFKNFISKIRNKQVFIFRPVGPFMEKKRPFESSPKNQNQDKRRKFDGNKNVTSKIPPCSMCKEKKNKENFHLEEKCIFYKRDGDGNIVEKADAQDKIKEYINSKKNTSNKPYSEPTVLLTNENISSSNEEHSIYSRKSNIFLLDSCANIPIVRRPVSNAISCNIHINTLERKSTVQSTELGITHVIAVDIDLKPIKIIFKAYYIPPYGLTMEENFNVLPAYRFCQINRKVPTSEDPQFKLDGIESKFSLIATDNSVVHFKTDLHNQMPILASVPNMDANMSDHMRVVDLTEQFQTPEIPQVHIISRRKSPEILAMQIHQQFGHAPFRKIKSALGTKELHKSVDVPLSEISQSVVTALQNLHCEDCQRAKKDQIQHPRSSKHRRSKIPFQIVYVDMCYNPYYNNILNEPNKKIEESLLKANTAKMLRTTIDKALESFNDSTYLTFTAYECPFALVFVDEATRWKEVVPLEDKSVLSHMKAFLHYRNQVMDAMAKLQSNPSVYNNTNLQIPIEDIQKMNPNKISFDVFERFPFKIQQFKIDQEGAMESAAFKEFIKRYWIFQTHAEKTQYNPIDVKSRVEQTLKNNELSFTIHKVKDNEVKHIFQSSTIQAVPTNQHQFNGIAERAIRTLKDKAIQNYETAFKYLDQESKQDSIKKWWFWSMHYAATISNILPITINNKIEPSPYFQITGEVINYKQLIPFWDKGYAIVQPGAKKNNHNLRHENREEVRYLSSLLLGKIPYPIHLKHEAYIKYLLKGTSRQLFKQSYMSQLITKHTDTNYNYHTFAKQPSRVEKVQEILTEISELEHEIESLEEDLSNTETPEDAQQIGDVELPNSDSVLTEAIPALVMYVESDDTGDSGIVNICFGDDDGLTELHELDFNSTMIDDSICGLYETTAEDTSTLERLPLDDEAKKFYCFATSRQSSKDTLKRQMTLDQFSKDQIQQAVDKELQGILDQKVMHEVNLSASEIKKFKVLSLRMLVTVKQDNTLKARLVARGFLQREGINYFQTYSPVIKLQSSRLLLQLAAITGKKIWQLDVKQAFLQAKIEEDVYVRYNNKVYKLEKALYGTKQASRAWNKTLSEAFNAYGCYQCKYDRCMFVKRCQQNETLQLTMAVSTDDVLVLADEADWQQLLNYISAEHGGLFKLSQHGPCTTFNGIEIITDEQNPHKISMNQNTYTRLLVQKMCEKFNLHCISERKNLPDYKSKTPLSEKDKHLCNEKEIKEYQSIVGALTWIATQTRPDLLHFSQNAARASKKPNIIQLQKVRESIGYLKANLDMSIIYDGENIDEFRLIAYSDSDHRSRSIFTQTIPDDDTKCNRSTSGYVIMAGSAAIAYTAKLQSRVVPSSKDAEFNAAYLCIQQIKKLQGLLKELGFPQTKTVLFMDNLPCIKTFIGDNDGDLDFTSDALELHMIKEAKQHNELYPIHIKGTENIADVFTKANAPNFSQVISFITGNKLSALKMQEHHFNLIKEGYVGTLSSVDNPTFDQFKKHLLTQHKIQGIQLPNVISDVQTEEKPKTKKKKKYKKRKNKNKKDTSAYVQPMQPSAARDMGS